MSSLQGMEQELYPEDYLKKLCDTYQLEEMTKECQSDYEKVQKISAWVSDLYYMDSGFKNIDGGYTTVMFVPDGGKNITKFQRNYEIHRDYYLRNEQMFYYRKEDCKKSCKGGSPFVTKFFDHVSVKVDSSENG